MKKFFALVLISMGVFILAGCSGHRQVYPRANTVVSTIQAAPAAISTPVSLDGVWHQKSGMDGVDMAATVKNGVITIGMTFGTNGDNDTGLYWQGTFSDTPFDTFTSMADERAMDSSIIASEDLSKKFTYTNDGNLIFQCSFMGITSMVDLTKGAP